MARAWIDGRPAALEACDSGSRPIACREPLPAHRRASAPTSPARAPRSRWPSGSARVVDHMHSDALLRDLAVVREAGMMVTTPNEARLRADTLLLVGPGLEEAWPDLRRMAVTPRVKKRCRHRAPSSGFVPGARRRPRHAADHDASAAISTSCRPCSPHCVRVLRAVPPVRSRVPARTIEDLAKLPARRRASASPYGRRRASMRSSSRCCAASSTI